MLHVFTCITKKAPRPLSPDEAAGRIRDLAAWPVFAPRAEDVLDAIALQVRSRLSFRDAMVVHAAAESRCDVLWTEDLSHGQVLHGVRIRNPFLESAD